MSSILDKKFTQVWQSLKKSSSVKSSPWFKKADAAVSLKVEAYQKALAAARSGLVEDLVKLGNALRDLEKAFVKFVDANVLDQIGDGELNQGEKSALVADIKRCKTEIQHERNLFDSRLKSALAAAGNDFKNLESAEDSKKKELWKGFGIDL